MKLIIHIGPPKTATTALQKYFENLNNPSVHYAGVFQPRSKENDSIADWSFRYCCGRRDIESESVQTFLSSMLAKHEYVIVSEEMFLLHSPNVSIEEKLVRLRSLTKQFDTSIVIAVRSPESALPSFYQEIYKGLPTELQNDFRSFEASPYAQAYHYQWLVEMLTSVGFESVNLVKFQNLVQGKLSLGDILKDLAFTERVELESANTSKLKDGKRKLERLNLISAWHRRWSRKLPRILRRFDVIRPLARLLPDSTKHVILETSELTRQRFERDMKFIKGQLADN